MKTHHLTTPIKNEDLEGIEIGDIVYLSGYLITSRDDVHMRLVKQHRPLPVDLAGKAIFHAGPIMVPTSREAATRSFRSAPRPPCAWKSSSANSSATRASKSS